MWQAVNAGPEDSFRKKGKREIKLMQLSCFHIREASGCVIELKNTAERMSKGGFTL